MVAELRPSGLGASARQFGQSNPFRSPKHSTEGRARGPSHSATYGAPTSCSLPYTPRTKIEQPKSDPQVQRPRYPFPMASETPQWTKRAHSSSDQPPRIKRRRSALEDSLGAWRKRAHSSSDQPRHGKRPRSASDDCFISTATDSLGATHPESIQLRLDK